MDELFGILGFILGIVLLCAIPAVAWIILLKGMLVILLLAGVIALLGAIFN